MAVSGRVQRNISEISSKSISPSFLPVGWALHVMLGADATTVFHENVKDVSRERRRGPSSPLVMGAQISLGVLSAGWCFPEREVTVPGWSLCSLSSMKPLSQAQRLVSIVECGRKGLSKDDGQVQIRVRGPLPHEKPKRCTTARAPQF